MAKNKLIKQELDADLQARLFQLQDKARMLEAGIVTPWASICTCKGIAWAGEMDTDMPASQPGGLTWVARPDHCPGAPLLGISVVV